MFSKICSYIGRIGLQVKNTTQFADIINRHLLFCGVHLNKFRFRQTNLVRRLLFRAVNKYSDSNTYSNLSILMSRLGWGWAKSTGTPLCTN